MFRYSDSDEIVSPGGGGGRGRGHRENWGGVGARGVQGGTPKYVIFVNKIMSQSNPYKPYDSTNHRGLKTKLKLYQ